MTNIPSNTAYGTWEFDVNFSSGSKSFGLINNKKTFNNDSGYIFAVGSLRNLAIVRRDTGVSVKILETAAYYVGTVELKKSYYTGSSPMQYNDLPLLKMSSSMDSVHRYVLIK